MTAGLLETPLRDDFGDDAANAGAGQANGAGRPRRQVEHAAANERAAVVDGHDDAAVAMGDLELGAERQGTVGRGHGVLIEALTRGGPAAGLAAIIGSDAREAPPHARHRGDRGIGVTPGRQSVGLGDMVKTMMVVAMVPVRLGQSFGSSPGNNSCGKKNERRARPGYFSQCLLVNVLHYISPSM